MFRYSRAAGLHPQRMRYKTLPLKNGFTANPGMTLKIVDDRYEEGTTNGIIDAVYDEPTAKTGNAAGTVTGHGRLVKDSAFLVSQNGLSDATTQIGDTLDLAAGGLLPAATANADMKVVAYDRARDWIEVEFLRPGI